MSRASRTGAALALAAALWLGAGAARGAEPFLPAEGACEACAALVVGTGPRSGEAAAVAAALRARGVRVTRLDDPPPYRLLHHAGRLFREAGQAPGARLVFWHAGPVEAAEGGPVLRAGAPAPGGAGAAGLPLGHLLRLARESAAAAALLVLDAALPAGSAPALGPPPSGAPVRLLALRATGPGAAPLAPAFERLLRGGAVSLAEAGEALAAIGRAGHPGARAAAPGVSSPAGILSFLPSGAGGGDVPVPGANGLVPPGLAAPLAPPGDAAARCDRLAGHPEAEATPGRGVADGEIDPAEAAPACLAALLADPEALRHAYHYARVLAAAGERERAAALLEAVAARGHAPAAFALGAAWLAGEGAARDRHRAVALIERAAEAGFGPAVRRYGEIAALGEGGLGDAATARRLLARAAEAGDARAALILGLAVERAAGGSPEALREARALYARAAEAGLEPARQAEARVAMAIDELALGAAVGRCDRALAFDVMEIETFVDQPPEVSNAEAIGRVFARVDAMLDRIDWRAALETCAPLAGEAAAPPGLLSRLAYLLWRAQRRGGPERVGGGAGRSWLDLVDRAAGAGDPVALYLRGWAGMIRGSALLREGREPEAARQAAAAEESFRAAAEGGIAQAAFLGARMHLSGGWADLPGFRQEPRSALAMLEAVQARAPRARALLVEIYEGSERYRHLDGLRSPARARELKEQAAHRERG